MSENLSTETKFGPARYHVHEDGELTLVWEGGLTLNRVTYVTASVRSYPNGASATLRRAEWRKEATPQARAAVCAEVKRLRPLLVTPQARARAAVELAASRVEYARKDADECARTLQELQAAHAAAVQLLKALTC